VRREVLEAVRLQWGRDQLIAEICRRSAERSQEYGGFNGAAIN